MKRENVPTVMVEFAAEKIIDDMSAILDKYGLSQNAISFNDDIESSIRDAYRRGHLELSRFNIEIFEDAPTNSLVKCTVRMEGSELAPLEAYCLTGSNVENKSVVVYFEEDAALKICEDMNGPLSYANAEFDSDHECFTYYDPSPNSSYDPVLEIVCGVQGLYLDKNIIVYQMAPGACWIVVDERKHIFQEGMAKLRDAAKILVAKIADERTPLSEVHMLITMIEDMSRYIDGDK